jgi:hypothetical protein
MTQLTDAQVMAIAVGTYLVEPHEAQALALEVQSTRQRRCGNCKDGTPRETSGVLCEALVSEERGAGIVHDATWFCADWRPR